jgi:hypothetical protein
VEIPDGYPIEQTAGTADTVLNVCDLLPEKRLFGRIGHDLELLTKQMPTRLLGGARVNNERSSIAVLDPQRCRPRGG